MPVVIVCAKFMSAFTVVFRNCFSIRYLAMDILRSVGFVSLVIQLDLFAVAFTINTIHVTANYCNRFSYFRPFLSLPIHFWTLKNKNPLSIDLCCSFAMIDDDDMKPPFATYRIFMLSF